MNDVINLIERQSLKRLLFWVVLIAFSIRLLYFFWSINSPFLFQYSADERFYIDFSQHLLAGIPFQYANFMDAFLAYVLTLPLCFTKNPQALRLFFLVLDCINVWLVFQLSLLLFKDKKHAFVAALFYGLYGLAIIYSVFINKTTLLNLFLLLQAIVLVKGHKSSEVYQFFLAGLLAFFVVQLGAGFIILLLLNIVAIAFFSTNRRFVIVYLLGFLLALGSYGVLIKLNNSSKTLFPNNGGIIFYIANNDSNKIGTHISPLFVENSTPIGIQQAFKKAAEDTLPHSLSDAELSRFWYLKTWTENKDNLSAVIKREVRKLLFILANTELSQNYYLPYIKDTTLKGIPFINMAFLLAFAGLGVQSYKKLDFDKAIILMPIVVTAAIMMIFFVSARMRLSMMPFLAIFASTGVFLLAQESFKKLATVVVIFSLSLSLGYFLTPQETIQDRYNLALVMSDAGLLQDSTELINDILKESTLPKYRFLKANLLAKSGNCKEAIILYSSLIKESYSLDDVLFNQEHCIKFLKLQNL